MKLYVYDNDSILIDQCDIRVKGRHGRYVPRAVGRLLFSGEAMAVGNGKARTVKRYGHDFYLRLQRVEVRRYFNNERCSVASTHSTVETAREAAKELQESMGGGWSVRIFAGERRVLL